MIAARQREDALFYLHKKLGHLVPWKLRKALVKRLYSGDKPKPKTLTVDLTGSCNLRCPSCPVGSIGQIHPSGLMDLEMFKNIVDKAKREQQIRIVALHNWTEPFLHPDLPLFIRAVKDAGLICSISSNLTLGRNIEAVVDAAPDYIRISLSGFTQESYGITHARGHIDQVKANMKLLSQALERSKHKRTCVTVLYHKYRHNLEEMPQMQAYTSELGFEWEEIWAYYMSLEKVTQAIDGNLSDNDKDFVENRLALPISEAIDAAKCINGHQRCRLLEDEIVLDYAGNVNLCCAVYDYSKNQLGHFLNMDENALKTAKSNHPTCKGCTANNLHLYFTYYDVPQLRETYEQLAQDRITLKNKHLTAENA